MSHALEQCGCLDTAIAHNQVFGWVWSEIQHKYSIEYKYTYKKKKKYTYAKRKIHIRKEYKYTLVSSVLPKWAEATTFALANNQTSCYKNKYLPTKKTIKDTNIDIIAKQSVGSLNSIEIP